MSITELLLAIGDENVRFQPLDQCALSLDWSRKSGGKITFGTDQEITPGEGTKALGLIVWLDRDLVAKALADGTGKGPVSTADASVRTPNPSSLNKGEGR